MSISSRIAIANMSAELGADFALFEADDKVMDYVKARTDEPFKPVFADKDAKYEAEYKMDASKLTPKVACPHLVGNVKDVTEMAGTKIDQAFLGSCTNGRYEDLAIAASILKGRKIHPDVRLIVHARLAGGLPPGVERRPVEIFNNAEALITNSTCGCCGGNQMGVLGQERSDRH